LAAILIAYPHLPNRVPTHWNMEGRANGYSTKWTLFLFGPGFMVATMLLFYFLPWLSPKHWQVDTFQFTSLYIMVVLVSMLAYFTGVSIWDGLGHVANVDRAIVGGVCLLFALLGNVMGKVRRNFFIGVRTPWALANERVWNATHRFAAKTFGWLPFAALMAGALFPVVYSLVFYKQLERRGEL
jgi:uncharacterized membrane protein